MPLYCGMTHQSKARIRLPISRSLWLWSYLAPFSRYGNLLAKNCLFLPHFCYPFLIRCPRSLCSFWNFAVKLTMRKLESWGYPPVKTAWSYLESFWHDTGLWRTVRRTDGRTVRQTESIISKTALCIASYADALSKMICRPIKVDKKYQKTKNPKICSFEDFLKVFKNLKSWVKT